MNGRRFEKLLDSLPAFLAGASLGMLASWALSRGGRRGGEGAPATRVGWSPAQKRLSEALEGAAHTLAGARSRVLGEVSPPPDVDALRARLREIAGAEGVELRDLGGGIIEALGAAPDLQVVERVLASLRARPEVSVVVNRIWTPSSPGPDQPPDLVRGTGQRLGAADN